MRGPRCRDENGTANWPDMAPDRHYTQVKGDHAELRVQSLLKRYRWNVLVPFSESQKYDIVAERNGEFVRIQVKSSVYDDTSVTFPCYCSNSSKSGNNRTDYTEADIEGFAVYNASIDTAFWVPVSEANKNTMAINMQEDSARNPVSEYQFADRFGVTDES